MWSGFSGYILGGVVWRANHAPRRTASLGRVSCLVHLYVLPGLACRAEDCHSVQALLDRDGVCNFHVLMPDCCACDDIKRQYSGIDRIRPLYSSTLPFACVSSVVVAELCFNIRHIPALPSGVASCHYRCCDFVLVDRFHQCSQFQQWRYYRK